MRLKSKIYYLLTLFLCSFSVCACNSTENVDMDSNKEQYSQIVTDVNVETQTENFKLEEIPDIEMEITTSPSYTSNIEQSDENKGWKNAYRELIKDVENQYDISFFNFALININNDSVPELYLADTTDQIVGGIYSYNEDSLVNILPVENRQSLYGCIPEEARIFTYAMWLEDETITVYEYSDSTLNEIHVFSYISGNDEYIFDNKTMSKESYMEKFNDETSKMIEVQFLNIDEIKEILK